VKRRAAIVMGVILFPRAHSSATFQELCIVRRLSIQSSKLSNFSKKDT
jgi:hypothetical protein